VFDYRSRFITCNVGTPVHVGHITACSGAVKLKLVE